MGKINPKKMKVAELKAELESREISIERGMKKADLVGLLISALDTEFSSGPDTADESLVSEIADDLNTTAPSEGYETAKDDTINSYKETEIGSESLEEVTQENEPKDKEIVENLPEEPSDIKQNIPDSCVEQEAVPEIADSAAKPSDQQDVVDDEKIMNIEQPNEEVEKPADKHDDTTEPMQVEQTETKEIEEDQTAKESSVTDLEQPTPEPNTSVINDHKEVEEETTSAMQDVAEKIPQTEDETQVNNEETSKNQDNTAENKEDSATKFSEDIESEKNENSRKRRFDDANEKKSRYEDRYVPPPEEPVEEFDESLVVLDVYDSDLNMKLHRDRLTAQTLTLEGFAYLWGGARATYGIKEGAVCFECKLVEDHSVRHLPSTETNRHMIRLGWSTNDTSLMLGESNLSYGICRSGKAVTNATSTDFGEVINEGDVIGCYLDFTDQEKFKISYTKNGVLLGTAFHEEKEKLEGKALFPHVSCRNMTVEFNFGLKEEPFFPHPEEFNKFCYLSTIPHEVRVKGAERPKCRKECEVIMLCGLPGAGKTFWANKHVKENPNKKYQVLGIHDLLTRMKVTGLDEEGRTPESLMQHASNCLNRLFQVSSRKNRNFIFDQTNVFASAQRRKLRAFEGYQRKAVVVVPADEEFRIRLEKHIKDEQKEIPDMAVYEMKANFTMPEEGDLFDEVIFAELPKDEASKLIEQYRDEAKKKGPPPEKRFRGGFDDQQGSWNNRGGMMQRPQFRGGNRGGYNNFGGGNRGGGGFGGGNRRNQGSGWNNNNRGGGGGGGGNWNRGYGNRTENSGENRGGMNRNNRGGLNNKNYDRNMGNNYNNRNQNQGRQQQNNRQQNYGQNRNQGQRQQASSYNYHQAYQQQTAQLSAQANTQRQQQQQQQQQQQVQAQQTLQQQTTQQHQQTQQAYQQQAYNAQAGQPDYTQQWAQYYQQQAAQQQQQAAVAAATAAQYQNYYASYQQAYGSNPSGANGAPPQ